jgi:hypothetical protein
MFPNDKHSSLLGCRRKKVLYNRPQNEIIQNFPFPVSQQLEEKTRLSFFSVWRSSWKTFFVVTGKEA